MSRLLLVPLEDIVVFPNMSVTLTVDVGDEERVLLVPRHESDYARVGTVVEVADRVRLPGGVTAVQVNGLHRAIAGAAETDANGRLRVEVEERPDDPGVDGRIRELTTEYRAIVEEILELRGDDGRVASFVRSITEPGALADTAGYSPDLTFEQKVELLETVDVRERLELAVRLQRERLAEMQVRKRIRDDVESGANRQQREYILRKQMESIRKELGEDDGSIVDEYRRKIDEAGMPDDVREQAERELGRLEKMGEAGGEASMIRTYLDWLIAVPWSKRSEERLDPVNAREVLDADHYGLDDVKDRIVEYLAVRKLREERGIKEDRRSGAILTLIGPPGTGKTSIGESVARALGREFVRMSLGGVRDEAEIRGHRRTYIGAFPGQIIQMMKKAGSMNPVFLLDEVDKMSMDFRGDPSAALLEVLDPEQNHTFLDHYLDVEYDLSHVMFICTANVLHTIPQALRDRMEVLNLAGYTEHEKIEIAKKFLVPKSVEGTGLTTDNIVFADDALQVIIQRYTREAGVRNLEREISSICRKIARKVVIHGKNFHETIGPEQVTGYLGVPRFRPTVGEEKNEIGVGTGLAWTEVGGEILVTEVTLMPGKGTLMLTGKLGDVMQESAQAAMSYVRSKAEEFNLAKDFNRKVDVHIHVPEGAIPKDGPSAGITMATALVSAVARIPTRKDVAMTGEITLRGKVLPIGGVKEKVLAAHRAGLKNIVLPKDNEKDLADIPKNVLDVMNVYLVETMDEVLKVALAEPLPDFAAPAATEVVAVDSTITDDARTH